MGGIDVFGWGITTRRSCAGFAEVLLLVIGSNYVERIWVARFCLAWKTRRETRKLSSSH